MSVEPIAMGEIAPEATLEDCKFALHQVERNAAIQQGVILRHVRDHRLHIEGGYSTFEECVEKEFGYTRDWAYKRIDFAETRNALLSTNVDIPAITNEGQARAIKPVLRDHGPEIAAEVLREAADDDGKLTARSISEAATRVIEPEIVDAEVIDITPVEVLTEEQWKQDNGYTEQDEWSAEEHALADRLEAGETVVLNMRGEVHGHLWAWAERSGLAERIDRRSIWGNPFILGDDGDRDTVCDAYANVYLPHKPRLLSEIADLKGRALGCWCAPARCHGDHLAELAARS